MSEIRNDNIVKFNPQYRKEGTVNIVQFPNKKFKLTNERKKFAGKIIVIALAATTAFSLVKDMAKNKPVIIPENKVVYEADYEVKSEDSWNKITNKFYDQEKGIESRSQFKQELKDANPNGLSYGNTIKVPNIIDENNALYNRLNEIDEKLESLKYQSYDEYNVEYGENFSSIAEKIVSNPNQINECINMIKTANNIQDGILPMGKILIPKSSYFELIELREELKEKLDNSLNQNYTDEESIEHRY